MTECFNFTNPRINQKVKYFNFRIFHNPVINQAVQIFHVPRVWRQASLARAASPPDSPAANRQTRVSKRDRKNQTTFGFRPVPYTTHHPPNNNINTTIMIINSTYDCDYMAFALAEAVEAGYSGEIPVGAVIADQNGRIIAAAGNRRELLHSPAAHAEILAIEQAARKIGDWRLNGCSLFVTLEPCSMCAGAIAQARISRLVFGAYDEQSGAVWSKFGMYEHITGPMYRGGVRQEECAALLSAFFAEQR
jgi:tRNA(adenine34) deaminase